jgi:hypothetical protein
VIGFCLIFILESVSIPYCKSINLLGKIYKFKWNVRDIQKNKVSELQYNLLLYMVYIYIYINNWYLLSIAIIKETVTHHLAYALNHSFCCVYNFFSYYCLMGITWEVIERLTNKVLHTAPICPWFQIDFVFLYVANISPKYVYFSQ